MAKTKKIKEEEPVIQTPPQYIFGWKNQEEVAESIWKTSSDNLLKGDLIFAFQDTSKDKGVEQIIVVHNFDIDPGTGNKFYKNFGLTMKTPTWSCVIPHVTIDYLKTVLLGDMESYKINKEIINCFKLILENLDQHGN